MTTKVINYEKLKNALELRHETIDGLIDRTTDEGHMSRLLARRLELNRAIEMLDGFVEEMPPSAPAKSMGWTVSFNGEKVQFPDNCPIDETVEDVMNVLEGELGIGGSWERRIAEYVCGSYVSSYDAVINLINYIVNPDKDVRFCIVEEALTSIKLRKLRRDWQALDDTGNPFFIQYGEVDE